MEQLPSVPTVKKILENLVFKGNKLTKKDIDKLLNLRIKNDTMLSLKDRAFLLEVSGMISVLGFNDTYEYLKGSQNQNSRNNIIKNSPLFEEARRRNFLDITKELRTDRSESYISCKRCHQNHVNTMTVQTRSADEGATTFYKCSDCGYEWHD